MKGIVFLGDRKLAALDFEDPSPDIGEVVVEIKASGMCGSDLHFYRAPCNPGLDDSKRFIAGHEPAGVVVAIGKGVADHVAKIGDRVMVHHYHGCTTCAHCRTGWPQLCKPATRTVYSVNAHGSHAPFMKVPASTLIPLHPSLSFAAGASIACGTGTAWGGLERLGLKGDETIVVYGQGPVGLSATLLSVAKGARVIAVDIDEQRLEMAKSFGAGAVLNPTTVDVPTAIRELTGGRGAEMALETSGATAAATAALHSVDIWGKVCFVGLGAMVGFEVKAYLDRQLNVMTSYSMSSVGQIDLADFVVDRRLDLDRLFTDQWRFEQAEEAYVHFDKQSSGKGVFVR